MIWRSIWRMESTGLLAQVAVGIFVAILGSLGMRFLSPIPTFLIGACAFLLIYRLRYKRL